MISFPHQLQRRSIPAATNLLVFLLCLFGTFARLHAQTQLLTFTTQPTTLSDGQTKVLNRANNTPHLGSVRFANLAYSSSIDQNGGFRLTLPGVNGGNSMNFAVQSAIFDDPQHYSIQASGPNGYVTLYYTPQGTGGTIDLVSRVFTLLPFGTGKTLVVERDMKEEHSPVCGQEVGSSPPPSAADFCSGDCGAAVLDVLLLRTPEANTWLSNTWGIYGDWFLYTEGHNINLALNNSNIPGKRVRMTIVNFTPDFAYSTNPFIDNRINEDTASLTYSIAANNLKNYYKSDIVVLLTNNNYSGPFSLGGNGTIFGSVNNANPLSNQKFTIVEVPNIDPSRYTLAHELAHHFGCMHSSIADGVTCPFGKTMNSGRKTVVADQAPNFSRIPYYSNPDVNFAGEPTGDPGTRNNAQQIRAAFCESANNQADPTFSAFFVTSMSICPNQTITFTSFVVPGNCPDPFGISPTPTCAVGHYQYEWRLSLDINFATSQVVGTSPNLSLYILPAYCGKFYLRLTVNSGNGLVTTSTFRQVCRGCFSSPSEDRSVSTYAADATLRAVPNPATDMVSLVGAGIEKVTHVRCLSVQGTNIALGQFKVDDLGQITIPTGTFSPGLYFFRVDTGASFTVSKVVIQ